MKSPARVSWVVAHIRIVPSLVTVLPVPNNINTFRRLTTLHAARPRTMGESLLYPRSSNRIRNSNSSRRRRQGPHELPRRIVCPCCTFDFDVDVDVGSMFPARNMVCVPIPTIVDATNDANANVDVDGNDATRTRTMLSPPECLERLERAHLSLVDTHCHVTRSSEDATTTTTTMPPYPSLTCAVEPDDWNDLLAYAATSPTVLPALAVHPWKVDTIVDTIVKNNNEDKEEEDEDKWNLTTFLERLEDMLQRHPSAAVGEIGLCQSARNIRTHPDGKAAGLQRQLDVCMGAFALAARYGRPVSVHCVGYHGKLLEALNAYALSHQPTPLFPPTIALHSYTGSAHFVREFLRLEQTVLRGGTQFYFGVSHLVNVQRMHEGSEKSRNKMREAFRAVPRDRLLVESDESDPSEHVRRLGTAGAVAYLSYALQDDDDNDRLSTSVEALAQQTTHNGLRFLRPLLSWDWDDNGVDEP